MINRKMIKKALPSFIINNINKIRCMPRNLLNKSSYYHINQFTHPYIIEKKAGGYEFLFWIGSEDTRRYYHLQANEQNWREMEFLQQIVKPSTNIIEIGSHHGMSTMMLAKWVGNDGKIFAIEPGNKNFYILNKNLQLNSIKNVEPLQAAVGDISKKVNFFDGSMGSSVIENTGENTIEVNQIVIDEYFENIIPDLIKIDVQGYVEQCLKGMKKIISDHRPNLAVEIDYKELIEKCGGDLKRIFKMLYFDDYTYFVQFGYYDEPEEISYKDILSDWNKRNKFKDDIHLFAIKR